MAVASTVGGRLLHREEVECSYSGLRFVWDRDRWAFALQVEKLVDFLEGKFAEAVGVAEGDYDVVEFWVIPEMGMSEGCREGVLLLQAP